MKTRKITLLCFAILVGHSALAQAPAPTTTASPATMTDKKLVIEIEIPAPLPVVWQAFTTSDGLSTWLTPGAVVDLRPGGEWTAHFPGGSTGGGTILSLIPQQELVLSALAPDKFPHVRADRLHAVFHFEAKGGSTIVRLTQTGWKTGREWDSAYEYLASGNAELLATLHHRFIDGPIDWKKVFGDIDDKK